MKKNKILIFALFFLVLVSGNLYAADQFWGDFFGGGSSGSGDGAPTDATYITQTADGDLDNEQALSSLSTGIMRVATTTGVITSITDSSGIAANISDETGSGALVFANSPSFTTPNIGTATGSISGNAGTATALAANGANCSAGSYPLGVDASGAVESCGTDISGNSATTTTASAGDSATAFFSSGTIEHERGGLEFDASAVAIGDIIAGTGSGTMALVTASGHSDGDVLTLQADGTVDYETPASGSGGCFPVGFASASSISGSANFAFYSAENEGGPVFPYDVVCDNLIVQVDTAPGSGKSWASSAAAGSGTLACTIADTATSCEDTSGSKTYARDATVQGFFLMTASGGPTATSGQSGSMRCCPA